jgi:hypothetical protein
MKFLCCALLVSCSVLAEPIYRFALDTEDVAVWGHKTNTVVVPVPAADSRPGGAVKLTVDPVEFGYGWINRAFPEADFTKAAGVHGFFRAKEGAGLMCHLVFFQPEGPSYFRADLGQLRDSQGEWVEFFVDFATMNHERGPRNAFTSGQLTTDVRLQFLAQTGDRKTISLEIGGLTILDAEEAAPLAKRMAREKLRRELLPEAQITGKPHPRLLLSDAEVIALKADIAKYPTLAVARDRIIRLADANLAEDTMEERWAKVMNFREESEEKHTHTRRGNFEGCLKRAVTPLETLGAAYRLTGDERYGRRAADMAVRMAKELTVDNSLINEGFYYTRTFYVRALAFAYDWTYDLLTPAERSEVKTTLLGFALDIHVKSQSHGWGRRPLSRVWNWDPGLMGAAGIGMLALEGETRTAEKAIIFDCRRHLRDYLTLGIDEDGCGHEGPSYIGYGIGGGVEFIELLRRQGRGDLFVASNYDLCPPWLVAETLPGGDRFNNLSDCGHGQAPWPVYTYACGRLAELAKADPVRPNERLPSLTAQRPLDMLAQFSEAPGQRQLSYGTLAGLMSWVWTNGPGRGTPDQYDGPRCLGYLFFYRPFPATASPAKILPLGQHFRGRGMTVSRTGFGPEDWHLAVEAGPHVAGHDQCDKGTFTLRAYGADLAIDSGYGNDGELRKSGSSYAHNVVLIDDQGQPMRYHNQSSGRITGFHHSDLLDWVRTDAREAWGVRYDHNWRPSRTTPVQRAERTFLFVRGAAGVPPYLVVMDDIVKDEGEHDYTWQWHIPARLAFETDSVPWRAVPQASSFDVLTSTADTGGSADFAFLVREAGSYQLAGLTRAGGKEGGKSDSFFLAMDDGRKLTWDIPSGGNPTWDLVQDRGAPVATFELEPGTHVVHLGKREAEAELAKLALVPAETELPVSPVDDPAKGITLTVADAKMGAEPFRIIKAGAISGSHATLEVFPVRPAGGKTTTTWFETSREGSHPRLQYTVRAKEPRFLMVLVPRRDGIPQPKVVPDGDWGVRVIWGDTQDTIQFSRSPDAEFGSATLVRKQQGKVTAQAWLDAPRDGKPTVATTAP